MLVEATADDSLGILAVFTLSFQKNMFFKGSWKQLSHEFITDITINNGTNRSLILNIKQSKHHK